MNDVNIEKLKKYSVHKTGNFESAKEELEKLGAELYDVKSEMDGAKAKLEEIEEQLMGPLKERKKELLSRIAKIWQPFIEGADESKIEFENFSLVSKEKITVKIESKDDVVDWLQHNGYKDVMTYDVNTNRARAILGDEIKKNGAEVAGAKYTRFNFIDVK